MSNTTASLRRKIEVATDLQSVARTMKALAASSVGQYEKAVLSLGDYCRAVELGLGACLRQQRSQAASTGPVKKPVGIGAIVFGSDQGLVGQFNDVVADEALTTLKGLGGKPRVWAVGERVQARLASAGVDLQGILPVPNSVTTIAGLVGQLEIETEAHRGTAGYAEFYVFHNRPRPGAGYEPIAQRLLPLDQKWQMALAKVPWPGNCSPEVLGDGADTLHALLREYVFISLFRSCAESLASENASRLAAMQRADKNIDDSLETLHDDFHRLRQSSIDEELFDVVSGYEALATANKPGPTQPPSSEP
jgi:F-type H+-transporting ATPase subunit gamma